MRDLRARGRPGAGWLVVGTLVLACGGLVAPDAPGSPAIEVDRRSYSWTRDEVITWRMSNPWGVGINYSCPLVEREVFQSGWRRLPSNVGCIAVWQNYRLEEGATLSGAIRLTSDEIPHSGFYRLVFNIFREPDSRFPWPTTQRVSPTFYVGP